MYLSPASPRWHPEVEADLQAALDGGLLRETHHVELKRQLNAGTKANRELARDLAQFAIDGGLVIVGVDEGVTEGSARLNPVQLAGLSERVELVARTVIDPPIPLACTAIPSLKEPSLGYLLIEVPATGMAPHMVDGVYYGRGDKTKYRLSDADVLRLHRGRQDSNATAQAVLDRYVARDPVPIEVRQQAHLFVIAEPVSPRAEMLLDVADGPNRIATFNLFKNAGLTTPVTQGHPEIFAPSLHHLGDHALRPDGAALTYGLTGDRRLERLVSQSPRSSPR